MINKALEFARIGYHVFPLKAGTKDRPLIKDFPHKATDNEVRIREWWTKWPDANIGISTSSFGVDTALVVIDVDNKNGKDGDKALYEFFKSPDTVSTDPAVTHTYTQYTPTGGRHLVYSVDSPVRQGVNVLGVGVDIRSRGGYVVGAGSIIPAGKYVGTPAAPKRCPDVLYDFLVALETKAETSDATFIDPADKPSERLMGIVKNFPVCAEGSRNFEAYRLACLLRDNGASSDAAIAAIDEHWRCIPPLDDGELARTVRNAYKSAKNTAGISTPEVLFADEPDTVEAASFDPATELNKRHAWVSMGGKVRIVYEKYVGAQRDVDFWEEATAKSYYANKWHGHGKQAVNYYDAWNRSTKRREFSEIDFIPMSHAGGKKLAAHIYNLWGGFKVHPAARDITPEEGVKAVDNLMVHIEQTICLGDKALAHWFIGYFAHLIQKPWEKPLVAIILKGGKGTGKSSVLKWVGYLLGKHYFYADDGRYLKSNFNAHLAAKVLVFFDEAFWAGDKSTDGILKGLVTAETRQIEKKGIDSFEAPNYSRVVIASNEDWIIPASQDERRYAVFELNNARKQDNDFFQAINDGMQNGGYRYLLRYLLDYDISDLTFKRAPNTNALGRQKRESFDTIEQWWCDCLESREILGHPFEDGWVVDMQPKHLIAAIKQYMQDHNIRSRLPTVEKLGRQLKLFGVEKTRRTVDGHLTYLYQIPDYDLAREMFSKKYGVVISDGEDGIPKA